MKKRLLTLLIAAMMILPLGTVAMADDKPLSDSPAEYEAYLPGEAPALNDVTFMTPALHAVLLAMGHRNLQVFTTEDAAANWEMLYNLLSMYGQMDSRAFYEEDLLILPAETVMDYSAAILPAPLSPETLPEELSDRMIYDAECDEYRLYCGSDGLSQVVIDEAFEQNGAVSLSGRLVYLAEEETLCSFTAKLVMRDNMFGYALSRLEIAA